jgi:hypothetical protein
MLVYEQNGDVFAVLREALKGSFNGGVLGLLVDDEEVLLGVWRSGDVLFGVDQSGDSKAGTAGLRTPTPARRRPVTESCVGDK